jgi:hypothetical protein
MLRFQPIRIPTWRSVVQAFDSKRRGRLAERKRKAPLKELLIDRSLASHPMVDAGEPALRKNEPWQTAIRMKKCSMDPAPEGMVYSILVFFISKAGAGKRKS